MRAACPAPIPVKPPSSLCPLQEGVGALQAWGVGRVRRTDQLPGDRGGVPSMETWSLGMAPSLGQALSHCPFPKGRNRPRRNSLKATAGGGVRGGPGSS